MSQTLEEMVIRISAETGNLQAEMAKVKARLEDVGNSAKRESGHTAEFGKALREVGKMAAEFLAVREVVKFIAESGRAAVENSKSMAMMTLTLKNATGATQEQSKAIDEQIAQMARSAGVMDDQIRPAFDVLVRATKDSSSALALQQLALDVSAGTGRDLTSVSLALAKAYDGNTAALARLVPGIKGVSDPMTYLTKQFAGAAANAANNDPYQRLGVAMDQIREAVGAGLLPILQNLANWLVDAVPRVQAFFAALTDPTTKVGKQFQQLTGFIEGAFSFIENNLGAIVQLGAAFGAVALAISVVQGAFTVYTTIVDIATTAQALFDVALGAVNPVSLAIGLGVLTAGIVAIGAGAMTAASQIDGLTSSMNSLNAVSGDFTTNFETSQKAMTMVAKNYGYTADQMNVLVKQYELLGKSGLEAANKAAGLNPAATNNELAAIDAYYKQRSALAAQNQKTETAQGYDFAKAAAAAQARADSIARDEKHKKELAAAQAQADKLAAQAKAQHDKAVQAQQALSDKLRGIVEKSLQGLRDAFASASKVDIGSMFADMQQQGETSADSLLNSLRTRLNQIQVLAKDAAALAGAGFSQLFIQQVVAQGPEMGDQLAQSILSASAQTQSDLKTSFGQAVQLGSGSFITNSTTSLSKNQLLALDAMGGGGQNVIGARSQVTINAPVSVQTNASPNAIANATVQAIKFGLPIGAM